MKYKKGDRVYFNGDQICSIMCVDKQAIDKQYKIQFSHNTRWVDEDELSPMFKISDCVHIKSLDLYGNIVSVEDGSITLYHIRAEGSDADICVESNDIEYVSGDIKDKNVSSQYQQGYNEAKTEFFNNRYQEGLKKAWEIIQRLNNLYPGNLTDMGFKVPKNSFSSVSLYTVIRDYSIIEVMNMLEKYDERNSNIQIGDEVVYYTHSDPDTPHKCVITGIYESDSKEVYGYVDADGHTGVFFGVAVSKTGKHYGLMNEILRCLKEGEGKR